MKPEPFGQSSDLVVSAIFNVHFACEPRREQRHGRVAGSASLLALAARGCPAMLGLVAASHNSLRSLRSLRSDRCDESEHEAREYARGHEPCASRRRKGALPATRPRLCRDQVVCVAGTPPWWPSRQAVPGGGDLWGGEQRRAEVGARTRAHRRLTRRVCPSAANEVSVASYAARPRTEQRSGVGAKRRPPHHEPPLGAACRDAQDARRVGTEPATSSIRRGSREHERNH